tara:strand:+ start:952 stop:1851 length:900 start_codon:yes stop_codon:yes gene_type:complete
MPRLTWSFIGPANGTGESDKKFLIDVSEKLSEHYGRLVRQSHNFTVKNAYIRVFNPDQTGEIYDDEVLAVSGKLVYFEPTRNRAKAWANGFGAWLNNRKALGIKSRGADFRVGLANGYKTDVGMFTDGVKYNAWINADDDPLMLTHNNDAQSLFATYNNNLGAGQEGPANPNGGFGHWAQKDADSLLDQLDFVQNEYEYYKEGEASPHAAAAPFMLNFSAWFDNSTSDPADFGSATNAQLVQGPLTAMCGLFGVYIDTVTVDDSETENQDYGIEVVLDIERWTPIMSKPRRKKRKGRKS